MAVTFDEQTYPTSNQPEATTWSYTCTLKSATVAHFINLIQVSDASHMWSQ